MDDLLLYFAAVLTRKPGTEIGCRACDLVGVAGFEPTASSSRTKRATKLRHTPDGRR